MKELFSAFGAAVFYPLVSLALPGLTAIVGWFVYFMNNSPFRLAVSQSHSETAFVLMLLSIFIGTVIDDLGTRLESAFLDRWRNRRTRGAHKDEWWAYLRTPFVVEPSGRRHLRRLVARLKFELGVPIGIAITLPAIWVNPFVNHRWTVAMTILGGVLSVYLLLEATATHDVLGELRHELLIDTAGLHPVRRRPVQSEKSIA